MGGDGAEYFSGGPQHLERGFTLLELMVAIAVLAILTAMALPSFRDAMRRNEVTAESNSFMASLQNARAEALTLRNYVSICPRATSSTTNYTCGTNDTIYEYGWLVYKASTANTVYTGGVSDASNQLLSVVAAPSNVSMRASYSGVISYDARGMMEAGSQDITLIVCYSSSSGTVGTNTTAVPGVQLSIAQYGRIGSTQLLSGAACSS